VPAAPPLPAISIPGLERVAALGWRPRDQAMLGEWLLRAAGGFTGRANSALAAGDPGMPLPEAVDQVCRWYEARGLPPMIAVPFPLGGSGGSDVDRLLARAGWGIRRGAATVMAAATTAIAERASATAVPVEVTAEPGDGWLATYHYRGGELPAAARDLLMSAPWQAFGSVKERGRTVAVGRVAAGGGWAGLTAVEVDPRYRRRGLATAVTAGLAAAAAAQGAAWLYLQVEDGNEAALGLYRAAGFTSHHRYHYRVAPAP
jgi:GNAT superfamily N-acetyltransferase